MTIDDYLKNSEIKNAIDYLRESQFELKTDIEHINLYFLEKEQIEELKQLYLKFNKEQLSKYKQKYKKIDSETLASLNFYNGLKRDVNFDAENICSKSYTDELKQVVKNWRDKKLKQIDKEIQKLIKEI